MGKEELNEQNVWADKNSIIFYLGKEKVVKLIHHRDLFPRYIKYFDLNI